jgi:hypothetical protein
MAGRSVLQVVPNSLAGSKTETVHAGYPVKNYVAELVPICSPTFPYQKSIILLNEFISCCWKSHYNFKPFFQLNLNTRGEQVVQPIIKYFLIILHHCPKYIVLS